MGRIALAILLLLSSLALGACDDDPFALSWDNFPDTTVIYSLARPETHLPSAFNFVARAGVRIEAPTTAGRWDLALDTRDGELVFLPPRALGVVSTAGLIALPGEVFEEVAEAPRDTTAYVRDQPVPVELGVVYVIRTHQETGAYGQRCVYYSKMQPLMADPENGLVEFVFDGNPLCNERKLIAPKD